MAPRIRILAAFILLSLMPHICLAGANEYALNRVLNVALLRIPSAGQSGPSPTSGSLLDPYIFDILGNRPDVKPPLWRLQNPLAPSIIDSEINSRFNNAYTNDEAVLPNMAPYWEVDLSKVSSATQLAQFNLLVIRANSNVNFTISQRRILRQYVDQGGTLWIDGYSTSAGGTVLNSVLGGADLFRVNFNSTAAASASSSSHPLATTPYSFGSIGLSNLGYGSANCNTLVSDAYSGAVPDITLFQQIGGSLIAGDYGSGHVIIDGLGISDKINDENGSTDPNTYATDETNYTGSSTSNLQFLVNILSYATCSATPGGNVRGTNTQGGNLSGALAASWQSLFAASNDSPSGVATYGNYIYTTENDGVGTHAVGVLNCFYANPALTATPTTSYELLWPAVTVASTGPVSPPVVALVPYGGANTEVVLVEDADGNVYGYGAVSGTLLFKLGSNSSSYFINSGTSYTAPGPTYYRGQIFAPQPSGSIGTNSVKVYNEPFSTTSSATYTFTVNNGEWLQPLLVASIPSTDTAGYDGNEIVAYAVTSAGVQSLTLGARDEGLLYVPGTVSSTSVSEFSTHAAQQSSTASDQLIGAFEDETPTDTSGYWILDFNTDNSGNVFKYPATTPSAAGAVTIGVLPETGIYADYNIVPASGAGPVRTLVSPGLANNPGSVEAAVVGASVGPDNTLYATVNETGSSNGTAYIEAVNDQAPSNQQSSILWRFELNSSSTGTTTYSPPVTDASGIVYDFNGYSFVGAPIVGDNGVVYALAVNGSTGQTRLMAFNTSPQVGFNSPFGAFIVAQTTEFGGTESIPGSQYDGGGITNFSPDNASSLQPSLYAPGQLEITQTINSIPTGSPVAVSIDTAYNQSAPMLLWYTDLSVNATSAPRLIGDYIYFGYSGTSSSGVATAGTVAICANPSYIGLQPNPSSRAIAYNSDYRFVENVPTRIGQVTLPPAATDKYLITAGASGFECLAYNSILVADSNRLIEFDPSGNATWTLDSTQQSTNSSALGEIATPASVTSVPLNRPSTVTQLSTNDYLIADTGNNRVVQANRAGDVLTQITDSFGYTLLGQLGSLNADGTVTLLSSNYDAANYGFEISAFNDPLGLLPVGQPLTLNQPSSVVTWLTYEYGNGTSSPITAIDNHYLISDTGNNRILDIVDRYKPVSGTTNEFALQESLNSAGVPTSTDFHYLNWISHTTDVGGRPYKYVSAEPILNPSAETLATGANVYPDGNATPGTVFNAATAIIGAVGDKNIPALDTTQVSNLSQIDGDTNGSSILLFNYSNGYPYTASAGGGYKTGLPTDLINSVVYGFGRAVSPLVTYLPLRGLRSVIATGYTISPPALGSFIIADDDGVFNGTRANSSTTNESTGYLLDATYGPNSIGWSFLPADYDGSTNANSIVAQYDNSLSTLTGTASTTYVSTPFVPASAIELSRFNFLIVNRGAIGNPNSPGATTAGNFGGNVFTVHATVSSNTRPTDTLDGPIYGEPANTGALLAPSFALRAN